ncbi:hypothetical protein PQ455_15985 [Sphingomonas naphthae]|uniref:Uncharacterized protein n=1 Tax=Sphingomonas naphthae TaxID=1813468 RepID=A0ABY7TJA1_9SPHN|nr:hypothetical protein [Sphingomonas naphthae]WCT73108.1 hypothetical protein PQ455_15985 [Sphingomonas naphthae]
MGEFPEWFPNGCPHDAAEVNTTLYHGCETDPASQEDFTPHARSDLPRKQAMARAGGCMAFGLSVWTSEADATHAQELFRYAARWHIFRGDVTEDDGQLAPTPTANQPSHHTFWAYDGIDLMGKFVPALPPLAGGA